MGPIEGAKSKPDSVKLGSVSQRWRGNSFFVVDPFKPLVAGDFPRFLGFSQVFWVSSGRPLADHFYLLFQIIEERILLPS